LAVAVGLAQLAFVAVEDDPGDVVPALVAVEPDVTVCLTKDANAATLRQIAELAPGSTLAMTFLLATELVDDADRAGLQMAENGARAAGTPFISFYTRTKCWPWPATPASTAPDTLRERRSPSATSPIGPDGLRPSSGEDLLVATI